MHSSNYGIKRKLTNKNSSMLWQRRLGHISNERIQRLVSEGILDPLDLSDFRVCIECIKGKQTMWAKRMPIGVVTSWNWYIRTFVVHFLPLLGMDNNILLLSLTITHAMTIFIWFMRSLSHSMYSRILKLKLRTN